MVEHSKKYQRTGFWMKSREAAGKRAVKLISEAFDAAGVPYFLDYGTLLGCVRNKEFIAVDNDIDFGICAENYTPKLIDELKRTTGSQLVCMSGVSADVLKPLWYGEACKNNIMPPQKEVNKEKWVVYIGVAVDDPENKVRMPCDIYIHYLAKGRWEGYRWFWITGMKVPRHLLENLTTTTFYDMEVSIPKEAEAYLELLYSTSWRIPAEVIAPYKYLTAEYLEELERRKDK